MINWLASYPKSGNTWVRLLLTAYAYNGYLDINDMRSTGDTHVIHYQAACVKPFNEMTKGEKAFIRNAALLNMVNSTKAKPLIVKTHSSNSEVFGTHMIPAQITTSAVYIVRDPRKVAPSFAKHTGKTYDEAIESMGDEFFVLGGDHEVQIFMSSWSNHVRSWRAQNLEAVFIKYEDIVEDTHKALELVLNTYKIDVNKKRIDKAVKACELHKLQKQEQKNGFREASHKTSCFFGQEHEKLTSEQILKIENDHAEVMEQLGYK